MTQKMIVRVQLALTLSLLFGTASAEAQSCNDDIVASTPNARFKISGDQVKDVRTNLTWQRCAAGQTWNSATSRCAGAAYSLSWVEALALTDGEWRLPNIKELLSIVESACAYPAINDSVFPDTPETAFWTASPYINNTHTWVVLFGDGNDSGSDKNNGAAIRLVKDSSD